jgi:hypothetical protein
MAGLAALKTAQAAEKYGFFNWENPIMAADSF